MHQIIDQNLINKLKKSKKQILICIISSIVITIGLMVPLFLFVTRDYKSLFTILLTIVATIGASMVLYLLATSLMPLNHFLKVCNESLTSNKFLTKGKIISVYDKVTHYKGVAVIEIKVKDLEEENKEYVFYVEQSFNNLFIEGKTYSLKTYQSFISEYDEVI